MALTYKREQKGVSYLREKRTRALSKVDQLEEHPFEIGKEQLIPSVVEHQKHALRVDKMPVYFFQRMHFGRPCSCMNFRYRSPDKSKCNICYGIGLVGGFNKIGTRLEILDSTRPKLTLTGVSLDDSVHPNQFKLDSSAIEGTIDAVVDVPQHIYVDNVVLYSDGNVSAFVKRISQPTYIDLTKTNIDALALDQLQLNIRITLNRSVLTDKSPIFTHLYLRWMTSEPEIFVDMPRKNVSISLIEYGLPDLLQSTSVYLPATVPKVTTDDFFIIRVLPDSGIDMFRDEGKRRYKITEVSVNQSMGILTSWDLSARFVQAFEQYAKVPE